MRIFRDKELTQEIVEQIFQLGRLDAGETERYTFWVHNDAKYDLEQLKFTVLHTEVIIASAPEKIKSEMTEKLVIQWSPSVTIEEALNVIIDIKGKKVFNP